MGERAMPRRIIGDGAKLRLKTTAAHEGTGGTRHLGRMNQSRLGLSFICRGRILSVVKGLTEFINARYGWGVPVTFLQDLGKESLKSEREFNRLAGLVTRGFDPPVPIRSCRLF